MLRLVTLAAAMVLCGATLELRSVSASTLDVDGGVARTARAVRTAVAKRDVDGHVWLGKLRGVGGGRDTLLYVPRTVDADRTIDVVVYMEGIGSFDHAAIGRRHVSSIARLRKNFVYVAPDAPSSSLGQRASKSPHWIAGCAERVCAGGHAAPGDFLVFLDETRARIAAATGRDASALDLRVSLIGFSRGGKGVVNALDQLVAANFVAGGFTVRIGDVIFADGNYGDTALEDSWRILEGRPEAPRLTILVAAGEFTDREDGDGNRRRALAFWRRAAASAPLPTADREVSAPRLRLVPLRGGHHAIGDAAVDFLTAQATEKREPRTT